MNLETFPLHNCSSCVWKFPRDVHEAKVHGTYCRASQYMSALSQSFYHDLCSMLCLGSVGWHRSNAINWNSARVWRTLVLRARPRRWRQSLILGAFGVASWRRKSNKAASLLACLRYVTVSSCPWHRLICMHRIAFPSRCRAVIYAARFHPTNSWSISASAVLQVSLTPWAQDNQRGSLALRWALNMKHVCQRRISDDYGDNL